MRYHKLSEKQQGMNNRSLVALAESIAKLDSESMQNNLKLDIRNTPIQEEEDGAAEAAMANVASALRSVCASLGLLRSTSDQATASCVRSESGNATRPQGRAQHHLCTFSADLGCRSHRLAYDPRPPENTESLNVPDR